MVSLARTVLLSLLTLVSAMDCPPRVVSCSAESGSAHACCVPREGLWLFKQRFEPDRGDDGTWGINNVDVLNCDGSQPEKASNSKLSHEEIGSRCARAGFDADEAERAWAQSEVGEGVEEVWERVWNTDGRFISSICDGDPSRFFSALQKLQLYLPTAQWLEKVDITPSADVTYALGDIVSALSAQGHSPVVFCDNTTLEAVVYPVHVVGNLDSFIPATQEVVRGNCPPAGIIYPPAAVLPSPTPSTWDPIIRPTMRPITLTHDESRQVHYPDGEGEKKKLAFFKGADAKRNAGEHGHERYARDEL